MNPKPAMVLVVAIFFSLAGMQSVAEPRGELLKRALDFDGVTRDYFVYVPGSAPPGPLPVVLAIHGYTSTATGFEAVHGMNRHAEKAGYIGVYPQGSHFVASEASGESWRVTSWNDEAANLAETRTDVPGVLPHCTAEAFDYPCPPDCSSCSRCGWTSCADDVGFLAKVLDEVEAEFNTDTDRYYVLGVSNGGMMALRMGCNMSDRFAAVAPIIAQLAPGFACSPTVSTPMLHLWGGEDDTVRGDGQPASDGFVYETPARTIMTWSRGLGCASLPGRWQNETAAVNGMQCSVVRDCSISSHEVVSCEAPGVGHAWPGMSVPGASATCVTPLQAPAMPGYEVCADTSKTPGYDDWGMDLIWDFFSRYSRSDRSS